MAASVDADARRRAVAGAARVEAVGAPALTPWRAAMLGAVQGPVELLPVSSSAHLSLVPWLAGWRWHELDPQSRKGFEVMVHAGAAAASLAVRRQLIASELRELDARRAALIGLSLAPPTAVGYLGGPWIERRLSGPASTAVGLLVGALALALADRRPRKRTARDATALDGIVLGLAQAAALAPGVSRAGATLAAARTRRFKRPDAHELSRSVALPVIIGATVRSAIRLRRHGVGQGLGRAFATGAAAAFASTLVSERLGDRLDRDRPLWPYAAYRAGLAALVLTRRARCG